MDQCVKLLRYSCTSMIVELALQNLAWLMRAMLGQKNLEKSGDRHRILEVQNSVSVPRFPEFIKDRRPSGTARQSRSGRNYFQCARTRLCWHKA